MLRKAVESYSGGACLEIGAGNCGTIVALTKSFDLTVGTDLVRPGNADWEGGKSEIVIADTATCFVSESFDLVVFNPPYLPSSVIEDRAVDGGRGGVEVPLRFLREALRVVKRSGKVVMVLSSHSLIAEIELECARMNVRVRRTSEKELFFERLYVLEASRD